jgi:hypothetical protein
MTTLTPRSSLLALSLAAGILALPACSTPAISTANTPLAQVSGGPNTAFIVKGQTSRSQLLATLGDPTGASPKNDGGESLSWADGGPMAEALAYLPYVGGIISTIEIRTSALVVELDPRGVVSDFSYASSLQNTQTASRD